MCRTNDLTCALSLSADAPADASGEPATPHTPAHPHTPTDTCEGSSTSTHSSPVDAATTTIPPDGDFDCPLQPPHPEQRGGGQEEDHGDRSDDGHDDQQQEEQQIEAAHMLNEQQLDFSCAKHEARCTTPCDGSARTPCTPAVPFTLPPPVGAADLPLVAAYGDEAGSDVGDDVSEGDTDGVSLALSDDSAHAHRMQEVSQLLTEVVECETHEIY